MLSNGLQFVLICRQTDFQMIRTIEKACGEYAEWKKRHDPEYKPWRHPEQSTLPLYTQADIEKNFKPMTEAKDIDESTAALEEDEFNQLGL